MTTIILHILRFIPILALPICYWTENQHAGAFAVGFGIAIQIFIIHDNSNDPVSYSFNPRSNQHKTHSK